MVSSVGRENAKVAWKILFLDLGCVSSCLRPLRNSYLRHSFLRKGKGGGGGGGKSPKKGEITFHFNGLPLI